VICLVAAALSTLPALAQPDRHEERESRREWKEDRHEDRRYWKEHDARERQYWKEREREGREYRAHRYFEEERGHEHGRRHIAPPWMDSYWRSGETRRYVALVPGDPSRMYVFLDGRWVLRQVRDPRARLDLEGAFQLPMAPPPIAPPRIGLDLHVVLFN
jgi:hypothetical protein